MKERVERQDIPHEWEFLQARSHDEHRVVIVQRGERGYFVHLLEVLVREIV